MGRSCGLAWLLWLTLATGARAGEVVLENPRLRAVLGGDAAWRRVVDKATGKDYCLQGRPLSFTVARVDGTTRLANRAAMDEARLTIGFAGCDTELVYDVAATADWVAFRLTEVKGTRPSHLTLVRLGVTLTDHVGSRLNIGWNDDCGICLMALDLQAQGRAHRRKGYAELTATTQDEPGPRLEGAAVALVAAPMAEMRPILRRLAASYGLPQNADADGVPSKALPTARQSYWFLSFGERDVERVIGLCRKTGFCQVMMGSGSWCRTVGHYTFHTSRYPDGVESLRRTVAKLHDAGILVGMHCFASKISKTDPYVTPVPDRRFWVTDAALLAADLGPAETAIRTTRDLSQWPGSPACKRTVWEGGVAKHQEVVLDDEIVRYERIGPKGKWDTLLGCQRGAWGTKAAAHKQGTPARRYGVDGCINGYIIDQETTLLDEAHERLARIFNTCGFDMVYFDGGEDVNRRRFTHYVSRFQANAMARFRKRPLIHMGTILTHNLWHSFTRSATVDTYLNTIHGRVIAGGRWDKLPTVKEHIDRSVRYMLSVGDDLMPGELGWFGIWPKGKGTDGLQLDEIEYLMCKSLAYDAPISLQTSFRQMDAHPLTPGILEIVKAYEELRMAGVVPEATLKRLREPGKDFVLLMDREARAARGSDVVFCEVEPVARVGGIRGLHVRLGPLLYPSDAPAGAKTITMGTLVTAWHPLGRDGTLVVPHGRLEDKFLWGVFAFRGVGSGADAGLYSSHDPAVDKPRPVTQAAIPVGPYRTTILFGGYPPATVRRWLEKASFEARPPATTWLQAEGAARLVGRMAKGTAAGVKEEGAFGDVVVCTGRPSPQHPQDWYAEYRADVPHEGRWTLWARVRYPSATDHSFGLVRPGEPVTLQGAQVLGNCGRNEGKWHWTGRGGGTTTVPPGQPITFTLPKGEFVFRVYAREGGGTAATNPRLDCLCLCDDPSYVPTDADAARALQPR